MFADSEHEADMLYAVSMFVPDPFIYARIRGREYVVMSDLEIDRAKREAPHCRALSLSEIQGRLRKSGVKQPGYADVIRDFSGAKKFPALSCRRVFRSGWPKNFANAESG